MERTPTSLIDQLQGDKMNIVCVCGENKAIFYCKIGCPRNNQPQFYCCSECAEEYHDHRPVTIAKANQQDYGKKWYALFEKVEALYPLVKEIFKDIEEFYDYCFKANEKLPEDKRYSGEQNLAKDFLRLTELNDQIINYQKQKIEELIKDIKLDVIVQMEEIRLKYEREIEGLEYLQKVTLESLFDRYFNVFIHPTDLDTRDYSKETLQRLIHFNKKAFNQIANSSTPQTPQEPQQKSTNMVEQQNLLIQITYDSISIYDQKIQKQISDLQTTINNADLKNNLLNEKDMLKTQLQQDKQQMINDNNSKINEFQQMNKDQNRKISEFQQQFQVQLEATENKFTGEMNKLKEETKQRDDEYQSRIQELNQQNENLKIEYNSKINSLENTYNQKYSELKDENAYISRFAGNSTIIKIKALDQKDYIRTFCQLQNGNLITGNTENTQLKIFNSTTLEQQNTIAINGFGAQLRHVIEHQGYIFGIDQSYSTFMVRSSDYALLNTLNNGGYTNFCLEVVDNNTIICGLGGGYLQLLGIQNTLSLKQTQQILGSYVYQIIRIGDSNQFLARVYSKGASIIQVTNNSCSNVHQFMNGHNFTSMVLLNNNLALAQHSTTYYLLNIQQRNHTALVNGLATCQAMSLVPGFHIDNYPFVIAREQNWIQLINVKSKSIYQLYQHTGQFDSVKAQILFLRDQGLRFVTHGATGEILMLELNKQFLDKQV